MTQDKQLLSKLKKFSETVSGNTFDNMLPREVFELIFSYILPQDIARECAVRLEQRFGSLSAAIEAPTVYVAEELNGNELAAQFFKLVFAVGAYYRVEKINGGRRFSSVDDIAEYCIHRFANDRRELYCALMVDANMRMLGIEILAEGNACEIEINLEKLAHVVFYYGANGFLLIHTHPSGLPYPSAKDEAATKTVMELFSKFNKKLIEHLLITDTSYMPIIQKMRREGTLLLEEA